MTIHIEATVARAEPEFQQVWIEVDESAAPVIENGMHFSVLGGDDPKGEVVVLGRWQNMVRCRVLTLATGQQIRLGDPAWAAGA